MFGTIAKLVANRLLIAVPILIAVSVLLFLILRLLPVDPAAMSLPPNASVAEVEAKRIAMGLDLPLFQQYGIWAGQILQGDFGSSIHFRKSVFALISDTFPATVELALVSMSIATMLGLVGGLVMFRWRGSLIEPVMDFLSIILLSIPDFMWSLFLILVFGVALEWLPFTGRLGAEFDRPFVTGFLMLDALLTGQFAVFGDVLAHMLLPCLALGISFSPAIMRVLRSSLLEVYNETYIEQARLRGVSERRILIGHALKNAFLPTLSLMGVQFGFLFGGTLLVEVIFSYPGMGNLMVDAVRNADLPVIQMVGLTFCVVVLVISIAVDCLNLILNPKLRMQ